MTVSENETAPLVTRTVTVITRHSAQCKDKDQGSDWRKCNCRKALLVYEGEGSGTNRRISAKTRSWEKAEKLAQEWRDRWDPEKQELKSLRAAKKAKQVRIEAAVALYISDMITRLGDNGTVAMARSLFGDVDSATNEVKRDGHLFHWLDTCPQRPEYIADFTPSHITAWRSSWRFGDLTAANRWTMVKSFFGFCEGQGWIENSPARKLKPLEAQKGSRTAIFTDEQYEKILHAVADYDPENVPAATRKSWQQRLTVFIELLRWSGMALVDAVQFRLDAISDDGVLRYRRQKSSELATIPLPEHVVKLLRTVPLEHDSTNPAQPFRTGAELMSDTAKWHRRVTKVFDLAGIKKVRTELGRMRDPHPHMLRDTFAVWHLRHGARLHTVSKMLGHAKTTTTEKSYLPWVKELDEAHIADARRSLQKIKKSYKRD
jgi:integrase